MEWKREKQTAIDEEGRPAHKYVPDVADKFKVMSSLLVDAEAYSSAGCEDVSMAVLKILGDYALMGGTAESGSASVEEELCRAKRTGLIPQWMAWADSIGYNRDDYAKRMYEKCLIEPLR